MDRITFHYNTVLSQPDEEVERTVQPILDEDGDLVVTRRPRQSIRTERVSRTQVSPTILSQSTASEEDDDDEEQDDEDHRDLKDVIRIGLGEQPVIVINQSNWGAPGPGCLPYKSLLPQSFSSYVQPTTRHSFKYFG